MRNLILYVFGIASSNNMSLDMARNIWPNASDEELMRYIKDSSVSSSVVSRLPLPRLVLISQDNIAFIDGLILQVGDFLPYDGWQKIKVNKFDLKKRLVYLSDKTILRLGQ